MVHLNHEVTDLVIDGCLFGRTAGALFKSQIFVVTTTMVLLHKYFR